MNCGLYEIYNTSNGKRYVGSSVNIASRLKQHTAMLVRGRHHSVALQRAWDKYGAESFVLRTIAVLMPNECKPTEGRLLVVGGNDYNISKDPHSPMRGLKHKPESIEKIRVGNLGNKSRTGMPGPLKGQKMSAEQIAARKPRMRATPETKARQRQARLGVAPWNKGKPPTEKMLAHLRSVAAIGAAKRWLNKRSACLAGKY
jgi:group I intron endonuclease